MIALMMVRVLAGMVVLIVAVMVVVKAVLNC